MDALIPVYHNEFFFRLVEEERAKVEQEQRKADAKWRAAEERWAVSESQCKLAMEKIRSAEDTLRRFEVSVQASKEIVQDITSCLALLVKDVNHDDVNPIDAISTFVRHLEEKLDGIQEEKVGKEQSDVVEVLRSVTERLAYATEDRKVRITSMPPSAHPSGLLFAKSDETGNFYETDIYSNLKENQRNMTHSSSAGHRSAEQSNPCIRAMWNQTLSTTARDQTKLSSDGKSNSGLSGSGAVVHEERKPAIVMKESASEKDGGGRPSHVPVVQSLAPRKSAKTLQTSAIEDVENLPTGKPSSQTGFHIFSDHSVRSYLPPVMANEERQIAKESDDDSENTPPLDSLHVSRFSSCTQIVT